MDIVPGDNLAAEILVWVGLVFAAGFIGYFGRYLGMMIIEKVRRKKVAKDSESPKDNEVAATTESLLEQHKLKLKKKEAKAEAKRLKKTKKG